MPARPFVIPACLLALAALTLAQAPAGAQPTAVVELSEDHFTLDRVGMTMRLPLLARAEASVAGSRVTAQIIPEGRNWLVNISTPQTKNRATTVEDALTETVKALERAHGIVYIKKGDDPFGERPVVAGTADFLERSSLEIGGRPAARLYVAEPAGKGKRVIKGVTIFKPSQTDFTVFELIVPEADFQQAKTVTEAMIATARFADSAALNLERGTAVRTGVAFLAGVGTEDWSAVLDGVERWRRMYQPAPTGSPTDATEIGYRSIKAWRGKLGEIKPETERARWRATDHTEGYLVKIRGRQLVSDLVADIDGTYFVSPDRSMEAWLLRTALRQDGKVLDRFSESGFRTGKDLKVTIDQRGQPTRTIRPLIQGDGYISQVEQHLLPVLIGRSGIEADLAFYGYQSRAERIVLRRDALRRDPSRAGALVLESRARDGVDPRVTIFDASGVPGRTIEATGIIAEPSEPRAIMRLWKQKGLPTDAAPTR